MMFYHEECVFLVELSELFKDICSDYETIGIHQCINGNMEINPNVYKMKMSVVFFLGGGRTVGILETL